MHIMNTFVSKISTQMNTIISHIWRGLYEKRIRRRLHNTDFSIICSTCVGGVIYHDLGLEFLSPTINLYMNNLEFIRFACNLEYYCSLDMKFVETDKPFPVAMLDDITINFNHSATKEEAERDWNRRKKRINYDNLYLIFYYRDGYTIDQLREIEKAKCKGKAVLTHIPLDLDYAVFMKGNGDHEQNFLEKDRFGRRSIEKEWDFVSWLNVES